MDAKSTLSFSLLLATQSGNYMLAFDYAVTLAYVTHSAAIIKRLESMRQGVEIKPGIRVPFTFLMHQYARMKDDDLRRKVKIYAGGRIKHRISVGDILEGIRYVNRVVLISCFEVMEDQKINIDIGELYKSEPNRESI
jgi:hypothetical protein